MKAGVLHAACGPAPVTTADEPVLQLKLNADGKAAWGATNTFDATEEGALVWDSASKSIAYCDGTNWIVPPTSSVTVLDDLSDVDTTTVAPQEGASLVFLSGKWIVENLPPPKLVFISANTTLGRIGAGGLSEADAFCSAEASAGSLSGNFKAWISDNSDSSAPANRFTQSASGYVDTVGNTIATSWSDLVDGEIDQVIERDQYGNVRSNQIVWTNTNENGNRNGTLTCGDWSQTLSFWNGRAAYNNSITDWSESFNRPCNSLARLYCFQQ